MSKCIHKSNVRIDRKVSLCLSQSKTEFEEFFKIIVVVPNIVYIWSRQEIDEFWKKKTESWLCGWVNDGKIYILHPTVYTTESDHEIEHFWQTLKHEFCHIVYKELTGVNYPKWLNEGLACYLAGQKKKIPSLDEALMVFKYLRRPIGRSTK